MILERDVTKIIIIPCECWTEHMELIRADWGCGTDYYITFKVDCFTAGQGIFATLKRRIQFAWQALMKGSYIHEELVVTRQTFEELQKNIGEILKEPDVEHGIETTNV